MSDNVNVTVLSAFDPPGYPSVDDKLTPEQRKAWSDTISDWMTLEIEAKSRDKNGKLRPLAGPNGTNRTPLPQFFNGRVTPFNTGQNPIPITWIGFPNLVKLDSDSDQERWQKADASRNVQDEYLEWTVEKDKSGRIVSASFTCEGPEYWQFLAEKNKDTLLALYKSLNPKFAGQMKLEDLLSEGQYNPLNKWNGVVENSPGDLTTVNPGCIVHLAQGNNTLGAEIDIAAQGTVIRKDPQGKIITDKVKLCNCSKYGVATRNSDPTIGDAINRLARDGTKVSIANPVAIYMRDFNTSNFMLDADGSGENLEPVPAGTFTWARGDIKKQMGLRMHIQIPDGIMGKGDNAGRQLTVSDIFDTSNSQNILYGAQFADYMTMSVCGVGISGGKPAPAQFCPGYKPHGGHNLAEESVVGESSIKFKTRTS